MADEVASKKKNWFARHKLISAIIAIVVIVAIVTSGDSSKNTSTTKTSTPKTSQKQETKPAAQPAERKVQGTAVTLGTGDFTGGQDVAVGLYDVTAGSGQSGNFIVNDGSKVNEVLGDTSGLGVAKVRTDIAKGDKIKISGLSQVTFTPVSSPFVTSHATTVLYAGSFKVGEDIGAGKYVVTPGSGESGNFIVNNGTKSNEVLGDAGGFGVPSVTITLSKGDTIKLSGLNVVNFTAQ